MGIGNLFNLLPSCFRKQKRKSTNGKCAIRRLHGSVCSEQKRSLECSQRISRCP
ncbi:unnamed protein product [Nippostrongylus brasiliensis]|uniref:Uncharacterized protein n=1 Tax=Nippostrongylus brasiliensis TaxID=27835 RepID=A0A0N4YJC9_NIPBR|nr:unnamed protein product [Nippostrongylus brasiliensis]